MGEFEIAGHGGPFLRRPFVPRRPREGEARCKINYARASRTNAHGWLAGRFSPGNRLNRGDDGGSGVELKGEGERGRIRRRESGWPRREGGWFAERV